MTSRSISFFCVLSISLSACLSCIWKPVSHSSTKLESATFAPTEVIALKPEESAVAIPSYPLRVLAKFVLSGISLGQEKSQDEFLIRRFNQAMEYLQAYYALPARDASHISNYQALLGEMHAGLRAQAEFQDELDTLIDPQTGQVIRPTPAHGPVNLSTLPQGSQAQQEWTLQRAKLSALIKQKNLKGEVAKLLAARSTDLPRVALGLAAHPFQFLGLGPISDALANGVNFWLSGIESVAQFAINPFIREVDLETLEEDLKKLASAQSVIMNQPAIALQIMRGAEILMQETQKILKEKMESEVKSGRFDLKPSVEEQRTGKPDPKRLFVSTLLSTTLGGYLELLPEATLKNLLSDLIDAANANPSPKTAILLAAQSAGPLLKKTMQMYARESSLDADLAEVLRSVEKSNEPMRFAHVLHSLPAIANHRVTQIYEKPIGVGSIADVYLVTLSPTQQSAGTQWLDLQSIQNEWRQQACLAAWGSQALSPASEGSGVKINCESGPSSPNYWFSKWLYPQDGGAGSGRSGLVPAILRVIKPSARAYLETEKTIFNQLAVTFDSRMRELEDQYSTHDLQLPRLKNIISSLIRNIEDELDVQKTVKHHQLARSSGSPYESLREIKTTEPKNNQMQRFFLRTRVPQATLANFARPVPLSSSGACFMEYLPGDDLESILSSQQISAAKQKEVGKELLKMWLKSAIYTDEKIIHADLHAGNLLSHLVRAPNGDSILQVAVIDFGMAVHHLPQQDQTPGSDFADELINLGIASQFGSTKFIVNALRGLATQASAERSGPDRQHIEAQNYLKRFKETNNGQKPSMESWFLWSQNVLPVAERLEFTDAVVNLMMGYVRINDLAGRLGGTGQDALAVNAELAREPGNLQKIARSFAGAVAKTIPDFLKHLDQLTRGNE